MRLFDTHAHLLDERFDEDRAEMIARMPSLGMTGMIEIGTAVQDSQKAAQLAADVDYIYAAVGVHPHEAENVLPDYLAQLTQLAENPKVVALGEIGLDYHYDFSPRDVQRKVLGEQLALAQKIAIPVVLHMRECTQDMLAILREHKGIKGVMHCFSGSPETAELCLDLGLHISFTGSVTFKNARKVIESARTVPLGRLMAETDCPYLSPEPVRGRRNEPANVRYVIEKLAEIKNITPDEMGEININNAKGLYAIS